MSCRERPGEIKQSPGFRATAWLGDWDSARCVHKAVILTGAFLHPYRQPSKPRLHSYRKPFKQKLDAYRQAVGGVTHPTIWTELRAVYDDARYWIEHGTYPQTSW